MPAHLAGFAAFPLDLHGRPDAQGEDGYEGIPKIVLHLHNRDPIDVKGIADRSRDLLWRLDESPEKGMGRSGLKFGTCLCLCGDPVRVTLCEKRSADKNNKGKAKVFGNSFEGQHSSCF